MWAFLGVLSLFLHGGVAQRHDTDLWSFVTVSALGYRWILLGLTILSIQLPEVRALKFEITHVDRERQFPGYWFVAPYGQIDPETPTHKYEQYQIGPYIYDNDGVCACLPPPKVLR